MLQLFVLRSAVSNISPKPAGIDLTSRLVQALLHLLQLSLKLLVLHRESPVCVLKQCLQVLNSLITSKQLTLRNSSLLLERGVLVNQLWRTHSFSRGASPENVVHTCFCTNVSCSRLRSKNAIFFCCAFELLLRMTLLYCSLISSSWISSSTTLHAKMNQSRDHGRKPRKFTFSQRFCRSRMSDFLTPSNSAN